MSIYDSKVYISDLKTAIGASVGLEALKGKSILITGATGTIGSFLVDMLMEYNKSDSKIQVYAAGRSK
jgi:FlaA1/EpsC-like NDP-sugar epimerase